jgi:hypothetical protein
MTDDARILHAHTTGAVQKVPGAAKAGAFAAVVETGHALSLRQPCIPYPGCASVDACFYCDEGWSLRRAEAGHDRSRRRDSASPGGGSSLLPEAGDGLLPVTGDGLLPVAGDGLLPEAGDGLLPMAEPAWFGWRNRPGSGGGTGLVRVAEHLTKPYCAHFPAGTLYMRGKPPGRSFAIIIHNNFIATESGTDDLPVARRETPGWESLHLSGEAPTYHIRRMNQTESVHRIQYIGASPLRYLSRTIPRRFTSGYPYYIRSGS